MYYSGRHLLVTVLAIAGVSQLAHLSANAAGPKSPCGDVITANGSGTVILPSSLQNGTCNITISRTQNATGVNYTSLLISNFAMKSGDYTTFYDGDGQKNNLVATVNGSREPFLVVSGSNEVYISIVLTANNTNSSMTIDYDTTKCLQMLPVNQPSLVLSPKYLPGRMKFECRYSLNGTVTGLLALSFLQFSLQNATLKITSGGQVVSASGETLPADVLTNDTLELVLSVPNTTTTENFSASLVSVAPDCFHSITVNGSQILTLSVAEGHILAGDCRVIVKALQGKSLSLNITSLQLTSGGDRLTIVDGPSLSGRVLAALTSVPSAGHLVVSSSQSLLLRLVLDDLPVPGPRILTIMLTEQVGGFHLYDAGQFEMLSPLVNGSSVSEYYVLEAGAGNQVQFDLGKELPNQAYVVSVYNGDQLAGNPLVSFSTSRRFPVVSSGNSMLVVATWINSTQNLSATLTFVKPGCDQVSSDSQGTYGLMAPTNLNTSCVWTIIPPPSDNATIMLELVDVVLYANHTLSIFSGLQASGSLVAQLRANTSGLGITLPKIAIPASASAQLVFSVNGNSTNVTASSVKARYQVEDSVCGSLLTSKQGVLMSPGFPNQYPLYSLCIWTIGKSAPGQVLFFDFPSLQLAEGHVLEIVESSSTNATNVLGTFRGSQSPADLVYSTNNTVALTFTARNSNSSASLPQLKVGQGFSVSYWMLDCGGNMSLASASFQTPSYPSVPNTTALCVWIVQLPAKSGSEVNIVNLTLSVKVTGQAKVNDVVRLLDGDSLRSHELNVTWSGEENVKVLSRYNTIMVIYNNTANSDGPSGIALRANYSTYSCSKDQQCDNGICLHPDWRCNGKDDCGDDSDERNCSSPAPSPATGVVKSYWVAICLLIGLLLGVVFTILVPHIIRRFRSHPYTPFRDEPIIT